MPAAQSSSKYREKIAAERARLDEKLEDIGSAHEPGPRRARVPAVFPPESVLVADGGNTAVWAMMFTQSRVPNTILLDLQDGMLGAGVAQACGAAVARPGTPRPAASIGDGAMGFHPRKSRRPVPQRATGRLPRRLRQAGAW